MQWFRFVCIFSWVVCSFADSELYLSRILFLGIVAVGFLVNLFSASLLTVSFFARQTHIGIGFHCNGFHYSAPLQFHCNRSLQWIANWSFFSVVGALGVCNWRFSSDSIFAKQACLSSTWLKYEQSQIGWMPFWIVKEAEMNKPLQVTKTSIKEGELLVHRQALNDFSNIHLRKWQQYK